MDITDAGHSFDTDITEYSPRSEMPRLGAEQRWTAIGMLRSGMLPREIAPIFGCSPQVIRSLRRRHDASGTVEDLPRSGRLRVTT